MKLYYLIVFILLFLSCAESNYKSERVIATEVNFSEYGGKTISTIKYCRYCATSGDNLVIYFTDGTQLKVYAYKYIMEIYK